MPIKKGLNTGRNRLKPFFGADDETRTRDPNLGKVVLYQLSYIRMYNELPLRDCKYNGIFGD